MLEKTTVDGIDLFDGESFFVIAATRAKKIQLLHPDDLAIAGALFPDNLSCMQLESLINALPGHSLILRAIDRQGVILAETELEF